MKHRPRDWTKGANKKRNATVCKLAEDQRLSYSVIAEMMGMTRNAVAGIVFRHRHPIETRVASNGRAVYDRNKIGTGYRYQTYYPEKTAVNTR